MTAESPVVGGGIGHQTSASLVNSFRLAAVAQRLSLFIKAGRLNGVKELFEFRNCCISLAKGIDFAIANNEVPARAAELPLLLKKLGWFQQSDTEELLALAEKMSNGFGCSGGSSCSLEGPDNPFSQIMARFYPFVKLGHVLFSHEVKPGCTIFTKDFHISKKMPHSTQQKIRLFVVQTDNIETSACIVNPPEVSFLLNGKVVEKRVNIQMDSGPQLPTNVTGLLKYGTNLLQAMGNFKGHYIIVLAFTDVISLFEKPVLKDYIQSESIESTSDDADLIEGPSRISLNCPISHTRIKLPVKGQSCKHLQCFDFSNYIDINMRKPSWRCPHCNQSVCYTDLCVDQNMVEVLKEVAYNAADVIISTGGSWKVVMETDEKMEPVCEAINDLEDPSIILNSGPIVLDLTGDDDEIGAFGNIEAEDRKPLLFDIHGQSSNWNNTALDDSVSGFQPISNGLPLDSTMLNQSDTGIGQEYANLSQLPRSPYPTPVHDLTSLLTSSTQERPAIYTDTSASIPASNSSLFHASPVTHHMTEASQIQTSRPETTTMFSTSVPPSQSSQASVAHCQGITSRLIERWRPYYQKSSQVPTMASSQDNPSIQNRRLSSQPPTTLRQPPSSSRPHSQMTLRQQPSSLPQSQTVSGTTFGHQNRFVSNDQIIANRLNQTTGSTVQSVSRVSDLIDQTTVNTTTNWRLQGRMRGSIVPGSYSADLDHMIIRPTQPSQVQTMPLPDLSVDIQTFLANHAQTQMQMQTEIQTQMQTLLDSMSMTVPPPPGFTAPSGQFRQGHGGEI